MNNKQPKYSEHNLIPMFIKAAEFRDEMIKNGFTDNGGAIHSAERIINLLGTSLKYPGLTHGNNYKNYPGAEFSEEALKKHKQKERVFIEHVSPLRDFTREAINTINKAKDENGNIEDSLKNFINENYRLVLLTEDETTKLNKENRIKMDVNRLKGINIIKN